MDRILGLGLDKAESKMATVGSEDDLRLLAERNEARKARDFKRADEIRAELLKRGYIVKDTPSGPVLEKNV